MHIVFDLDGTLIDSLADLTASAQELVAERGGRTLSSDEVAQMVGDGAGVLVRKALLAAGLDATQPDALPRFLAIYDRRLLDATRPYAGVEPVLGQLSRRDRLSVLTNKPLRPARRILDALQLTPYFASIVGGDGPHGRKPDPAGVLALTNGATEVVLVGDSPIDAATAQAAGCPFVWARYGFSAARFDREPETPFVLDAPVELLELRERLATILSGV